MPPSCHVSEGSGDVQPWKERLLGGGGSDGALPLLGALRRADETCFRDRMSTAEVGAQRQTSAPRTEDVSLQPVGLSELAASQAHQSGLNWVGVCSTW